MNEIININNITDKITAYLASYGINLFFSILIFFIGRFIAKTITEITRNVLLKSKLDETLIKFLSSIIYISLMTMVIISCLGNIGVQTTSFIAILGSAGLAIGLALQGSLSSLAAGTLLILLRPFKVGDFVDLSGSIGVIEEVGIFATTVITGDNKKIIIPNSSITTNKIINYTANSTRRVDFTFTAGFTDDLDKVKEIILNIVNNHEKVIKEESKKPFLAISELGVRITLVLRVWVKTEDYYTVFHEILEKVNNEFKLNNISRPTV
ncbi:MAG: mechanosensitive ion channel [Candidatus Sericytochromatia bacterium]